MQAIEFPGHKAQYGIVSGRQGPRGRKNKMKTTILTIALALATMPLTFAAQTPAPTAPAATSKPAVAAPVKTKKHHVKAAEDREERKEREDGPRQHHAGAREAVVGASVSKAPPPPNPGARGFLFLYHA